VNGLQAKRALLGLAVLAIAGHLAAASVTFQFTGTVNPVAPAQIGERAPEGGPGGVGFVLTSNVGPDFILSPGESFEIEFLISLQAHERFRFFVDLVAEPEPSLPLAQE